MPEMITAHPSDHLLQAYGLGKLAPNEVQQLEKHLNGCNTCIQKLSQVGNDSFLQLLRNKSSNQQTALPEIKNRVTGDVPRELLDHSRYAIIRKLGTGGMGVVYHAIHRVMNRSVALKVIRADLMATPAAVSRFRREVQAAAQMSHPNIVTAYDAEEIGGIHFLVMELVEGKSLDKLVIERGPLPITQACSIIHQATFGLQHAHSRGMIHRDIKPQNIMLSNAGNVKILDFGLARMHRKPANMSITRSGAALGSPQYLAPEQMQSASSVDFRADLYGLGATLYYLVTGEPPPVLALSCESTLHFPDDVPLELQQIILKLLATNPDDRFASARELAIALEPWATNQNELKTQPRPNLERFRWLITPAMGLLLIILLFWIFPGRGNQEPSAAPIVSPIRATSQPARHLPLRVLFLLPAQGLWFEDYGPCCDVLKQEGIAVDTATLGKVPAILHSDSMTQVRERPAPVNADYDFMNLSIDKYDAIICVGWKHREMTDQERASGRKIKELLQRGMDQNKWLVGIGAGQEVFGACGLLRFKRVARQFEFVADLAAMGATVTNEDIVQDGNIVTASSPVQAAEAGKWLAQKLLKRETP